jgi:hypothetical protein
MPIPEKIIIPASKDPGKFHFYVSMVKSAVRIAGCVLTLSTGSIFWLAGGFLVAEILGIVEEL